MPARAPRGPASTAGRCAPAPAASGSPPRSRRAATAPRGAAPGSAGADRRAGRPRGGAAAPAIGAGNRPARDAASTNDRAPARGQPRTAGPRQTGPLRAPPPGCQPGDMPFAVRFNEYGDIGVLNVVEVPRPVPGPGQVLVEVKAAAINP